MATVTCTVCNKTDFSPSDACKACGAPYGNDVIARLALEASRSDTRPQLAARRSPHAVVLTTTPEVPGAKAAEALGIVTAEVVMGTSIFRDLFASISDVLGGRSGTYQKSLRSAKNQAQTELRNAAAALGADAVVGIALDYSEISGDGKSMLMLVMSGTAVRLAPSARSE